MATLEQAMRRVMDPRSPPLDLTKQRKQKAPRGRGKPEPGLRPAQRRSLKDFHTKSKEEVPVRKRESLLKNLYDRERYRRRRFLYTDNEDPDRPSSPLAQPNEEDAKDGIPSFQMIPPEMIKKAVEIRSMPLDSTEQRMFLLRKTIQRQLADQHYHRDVINKYEKKISKNPEQRELELKAVIDDSHGVRKEMENEFKAIWTDSRILDDVRLAMISEYDAVDTKNQMIWDNDSFELYSQGPYAGAECPMHTLTVRDKEQDTITQFQSFVSVTDGRIRYRLLIGEDSDSGFARIVRDLRYLPYEVDYIRRDGSGKLQQKPFDARHHVIKIDWAYRTPDADTAKFARQQYPCLELQYFVGFFGQYTLESLATMNPVEYAILKGLPSLIARKLVEFMINNAIRPISTFCLYPFSLRADTNFDKGRVHRRKHAVETQDLQSMYEELFGVHPSTESDPFTRGDDMWWCRRAELEAALKRQNMPTTDRLYHAGKNMPLMANGATVVAALAFERYEEWSAKKDIAAAFSNRAPVEMKEMGFTLPRMPVESSSSSSGAFTFGSLPPQPPPNTGVHRRQRRGSDDDDSDLGRLCESMYKARLSFE